jgi:hypothetical protein
MIQINYIPNLVLHVDGRIRQIRTILEGPKMLPNRICAFQSNTKAYGTVLYALH